MDMDGRGLPKRVTVEYPPDEKIRELVRQARRRFFFNVAVAQGVLAASVGMAGASSFWCSAPSFWTGAGWRCLPQ